MEVFGLISKPFLIFFLVIIKIIFFDFKQNKSNQSSDILGKHFTVF